MRFILYSVFTLGWFGMWGWTYVNHIKCGNSGPDSSAQVQYIPDASLPMSFKWSDTKVLISSRFNAWRDSILAGLANDQILQITGISYRDEVLPAGIQDLGMQRAQNILQALGASPSSDRVILHSETGEVTANIKDRNFAGYRLRVLTRNDEIREMSACALLHFPYDSTTMTPGKALLNYVRGLAELMKNSDASVKLATLVQQQNKESADTVLTRWRLAALKNIIVNAGVPDHRIAFSENSNMVNEICASELDDEMRQDWIAVLFVK